ncbi:MAG: repeat protein [Fluviicola sp.]|jgi:hypothetical protein|uniref:FG-GAP-like repeat-containing protein n=1 Tax=Fluviicola sp. TaxID=1917219 RepID=UPI00262198F1|nr:FG-GAP-like repeat-containing protein [Fluviicola sp.]MDF3026962.1 repeat protein [Fluviicola sp.]
MKSNLIVSFLVCILAVGYFTINIKNAKAEKQTVDSFSDIQVPDSKIKTDISGDWYAAIQKDLSEREYFITYDTEKKLFQSPNRSQNIRSYYSPGKLELQNRKDSLNHNWQATLKTIGVYADDKLIAAPQEQAGVAHNNNVIEYKHEGFTEQYINNTEGVRQNFIVESAPAGSKTLSISLQVKGVTVKPISSASVEFSNENQTLTYSDLKVWDAEKRTLNAHIEINGQELALVVDAENASYPVTIDPIVASGSPTNANTALESNQASAGLGYSVSGAGDVNGDGYSDVIVGAHQYDNGQTDEGAAFIYHGSSGGIGTSAITTLESNQANAFFGTSVSNAGDVNGDGYNDVIVGARQYDNGQSDEGAAFVYHGSLTGISSTASSVLEGNVASANFGRSVSVAGDVNADGYSDVIIGAHTCTNGETDEGRIFVFHGSSGGVNTAATSTIESNQAGAFMGFSVSGAGDVNGDGYSDVIVGAYQYDNGQTDEGRAFIYHGSSGGINTTAAVTLENNQVSSSFGFSVSGAGDVNGDGYSDVIVGAYQYDNGQTDEGAVVVYHGSSGGINSTAAATIESNQASAFMGSSVSGGGDVNGDGYSDIVAGAYLYDNGQTDEGAAFVYHGSSGGINTTAGSTIESNQTSAYLGYSVSGAGDVNGDGYSDIAIGAYNYDNGQTDEGTVYLFHGSASSVSTTVAVIAESNQANAQLGFSVSSIGDVNADGYSDVIVGVWLYDNGQTDEGAAFVYLGSSSGLSSTATSILESNQISANFGYCVSSCGDVNGDGYSDAIISAHQYDNGQTDEGAAFVFHGSSSGLNTTAAIMLECNQASALMGNSVASAGDINGDGYSDIVVGAFQYDNGQTDEGVVFVYHGSSTGIAATATALLESNQAGAKLGRSSGAGDVNGDGYDDIIAGAQYYDNGQTDEGAAFVYHGSVAGINTTYSTMLEVNSAGAWFARNLFPAGDVNADGYSDIIVGAQYYDNGETDEGGAFVFHGSASGINSTPATSLESNQASSLFGFSVHGAGDVNGDGYSDVVVGAYQYDNGQTNEGVVFVYHGSSSGISTSGSTFLESNQANSSFGISVASAGDINGDGYSDILVGATTYTNVQTGEGALFTFKGNAGGGLRRNMVLYNTSTTTPIMQSNILSVQFAAGLFAKNPEGRTKGKLVWEVKKEGQPFTSSSTITKSTLFTAKQTNYSNLGITGTQLTNDITKPGFQTKVRARIQYDPATSQDGQVYSQWIYPQLYFGTQGMNATPLPVTLLSFSAELNDKKEVVILWQTASETNNDYFVVTRSTDGYHWEEISKVDGSGNSSGLISYASLDENPYSGISYYRLKQVDFNGHTSYSELAAITIDGYSGRQVIIYPNPAMNEISIESAGSETDSYLLYNCQGQEISSQTKIIESSKNSLKIDVSQLPAGIYLLKTLTQSGKFYKQ